MVKGDSLGGSYQAVPSPQVHEEEGPAAETGAAQPGEAATRPAPARCTSLYLAVQAYAGPILLVCYLQWKGSEADTLLPDMMY